MAANLNVVEVAEDDEPMVEGVEEVEFDFKPNPAAKQALDFVTSFPALSFAFNTGCEIRVHGTEEGTCAISVTNKGGSILAGKPVSVKECRAAEVGDPVANYLQHTEQAAAAALCVKSGKYRKSVFAEGEEPMDDWKPELTPLLEFKNDFPQLSSLFIIESKTQSLVLSNAGIKMYHGTTIVLSIAPEEANISTLRGTLAALEQRLPIADAGQA
mmetsp:Transcript_17550/g.45737  ORF Transcript_17550/g.45737 Transcript_17550/m.45737 type:complete len:214 (+) Transcript_17550:193-834(+)|eukprot:CAMPEP_0119473104 /NCGR_PEP_ID=MMETSP1344-20130328/4891_1 /TAXON_ID=236787 /ORGANISM="Florenciella parvula, Strain CCMP2471" /LENGTH=213 /DNA_ID=CAMNT_0007506157 /DNA_START=115 /DNA_END=756 /DNA_ORIENTATION=-